jgi:hypothetical protein
MGMGVDFRKMPSRKGVRVFEKVKLASIYAYTWFNTRCKNKYTGMHPTLMKTYCHTLMIPILSQ